MTKTFDVQHVFLKVHGTITHFVQLSRILNFGHWDLPFDLAQGGEPVEPFDICDLGFVIWYLGILRHCINIGSFILFSNYPGLTYPIM